MGDLRIDDFVVHPTQFGGPLLEDASGSLLDGKFIVAMDEENGRARSCRRSHRVKLFALAAAVLVDLFEPLGHIFDLIEERG